MKKITILTMGIFLMAGVAIAGESMMQSESNVKEKTTQSTTTLQGNMDQTGEVRHDSTTVEKRREETTSGDMGMGATSRGKVEVEKNRSKTTIESSDEGVPGTPQEYQRKSETHHEHSTTEVEKK